MKPQNQTVLTLIIGLVMMSAFLGVYYVTYQYETNAISETVFISDSNMEFSETDTTLTNPAIPQPYTIGSYKTTSSGTVWTKHNTTAIYTGNNTWGASLIGFTAETPLYTSAFYYIPIDVPDAKTFTADNITINMTLPGESVTLAIYLSGYNEPDSGIVTPSVQLLSSPTTATEYNHQFDLTTYQKYQWLSASKLNDMPQIAIFIYDTARDGITSYALELEVAITGTTITTWSLQDSINTVIAVCLVVNVVVGAYMLDGLDFNAIRKDLPGITRGKPKSGKRKSSKRKR